MSDKERLWQAYLDACAHGTRPSYRARINIIGHSGAGKTSLTRRLLGQEFHENEESTDGISTHRIEFDLMNDSDGSNDWKEAGLKTDELALEFNREVLRRKNELKIEPSDSTATRVQNDQNPRSEEAQGAQASPTEPVVEDHSVSERPDTTGPVPKSGIIEDLKKTTSAIHRNPATNKENQKAILRLWDFGGQTEFYTTHHMFLDAGALNIIALDISKSLTCKLKDEDEELPVGVPNTQEEFLCYWLKSIQDKATQMRKSPNVMLVLTHMDLVPSTQVDGFITAFQKEIQKQNIICKNKLLPIPSERIHVVNNKDGDEDSFRTLRCQLVQLMMGQVTWGLERPITWLKLEADMKETSDGETSKSAKHVQMEEAKKFADQYSMTQQDVEACMMFLNEMGDIVWFKDEGLKEVIILDPQWLVDIFKVLITSEQFIKKRHLQDEVFQLLKHGTVTGSTLQKFWAGSDVKFHTKLLLMFDLLVPVGCRDEVDQKFLVPCMLPPGTASQSKTGRTAFSSEYRSSFYQWVPIGTFPKLLAACAKKWSLMEEKNLSSTSASLEVEEGITLIMWQSHGSSLHISIRCQPEILQKHPLGLILEATAFMSSVLKSYRLQPSELCQLICPNWRPGDDLFCTVEALHESLSPDSEYSSIQYTEEQCGCHGRELE